MSNDLISRQEVLNFIQGIKDKIIENQCFGDNTRAINMGDLNDILIFIRNMQTAFDVDKIVQQLEEHAKKERELELNSNGISENYHFGKARGFIEAIDIVKESVNNERI